VDANTINMQHENAEVYSYDCFLLEVEGTLYYR